MSPISRRNALVGAGLAIILVSYCYNSRPAVSHFPNRAAVIAAGLDIAEPLPHVLTAAATSIELETWKPGRYKYVRRYWAFQVPYALGDSIRRSAPPLHLAAALRTFDRPRILPDWPEALTGSTADTAGYSGVYDPRQQTCIVVSPSRTWVYVWPCRLPPD